MRGTARIKQVVETGLQLETARLLRRLILALALFGVVGTLGELLLIGHYASVVQFIPFILLALALVSFVLVLAAPTPRNLRLCQGVMVLIVLGSAVGVYEHFMGNLGFQLELYPDLSGWALFWNTLKGGVPLLAPGVLLQVGLLGLLYTFRHPGFERVADQAEKQAGRLVPPAPLVSPVSRQDPRAGSNRR